MINAQVRFYISSIESESKYESSVRESKSSHESREWSLESDSSPKNSDSSRTRVRVQDSSTPSLG